MDTKQKILETATQLFAERGFDAVTVREIAAGADVAVSALNYHFKSKDNLLLELASRFIDEMVGAQIAILSPPDSIEDFREKLENYAEVHLTAHLANLPLTRLFVHEFDRMNPVIVPLIRGPMRKWFDDITGFVRQAKKRGHLRKALDEVLFVSVFLGELMHALKYQDNEFAPVEINIRDEKQRRARVKALVEFLLVGALPRA